MTRDVLAGIGLFVLTMVLNIVIKPDQQPSLTTIAVVAGLFVLLGVTMRWHAARRWSTLDWRIARMPRMGRS